MRTIPANLILRLVADILDARARRLRGRVEHNRRGGGQAHAVGRRRMVAGLEQQVRVLRALKAEGEIRADVAGLMLAWAGCWGDAIALLEEIDPRVEALAAGDYVAACRVLLGAR